MNDEPKPPPPSEPQQIIDLVAGTKLSIRVITSRYCPHLRTEIHEDSRKLVCRDCEHELDPFDMLLGLARHEKSLDWAKAELKEVRAEIEDAKRDLKNLKSRVKRASIASGETDCDREMRKRPWLKGPRVTTSDRG